MPPSALSSVLIIHQMSNITLNQILKLGKFSREESETVDLTPPAFSETVVPVCTVELAYRGPHACPGRVLLSHPARHSGHRGQGRGA